MRGPGGGPVNDTMRTFGYPDTCVAEYEHWVVLIRRKQITAGSLVLVCTSDARALGEVSPEAYAELAAVIAKMESALRQAFSYDKINYLALMMVDPQVHFHVVPRYASPRQAAGLELADTAWPGPPDVTKAVDLTDDQVAQLRRQLGRR